MSSNKFLDFEEVKRNHPIDEVAAKLGLQLKKNGGGSLRGPCPSGGGNERSLIVTPEKGVWYSFATQKGGDVIALVSFVKDLVPKDAAAWIVCVDKKPGEMPSAKPKEGFKELDYLDSDHQAVFAVGLDTIAEDHAVVCHL